jgi:hypothetical protein
MKCDRYHVTFHLLPVSALILSHHSLFDHYPYFYPGLFVCFTPENGHFVTPLLSSLLLSGLIGVFKQDWSSVRRCDVAVTLLRSPVIEM